MNDERGLSPQTKIMIGFGVVLALGLAASSIGAVALLAQERDQCRRMKAKLERAARALHGHPMPFSSNVRSDPTGQASLATFCVKLVVPIGEGFVGTQVCHSDDLTPQAFDLWGHPLVYRCPGPFHPKGWDLYSVGPDGIDDGGYGDDIVVGEDVTQGQ